MIRFPASAQIKPPSVKANHEAKIDWSCDDAWTLPPGMIWVQQLDIGNRRIETRLLVRNDAGAYGVSYRWDADQRDATLVPEAGEDLAIDAQPASR